MTWMVMLMIIITIVSFFRLLLLFSFLTIAHQSRNTNRNLKRAYGHIKPLRNVRYFHTAAVSALAAKNRRKSIVFISGYS